MWAAILYLYLQNLVSSSTLGLLVSLKEINKI